MKAVDTNIVVRAIVQDDPEQSAIAARVLGEPVFLPITVLLETGWVLASFYRQPRSAVADALDALLDLPTVHVGDEAGLRSAIMRFRAGSDLADSIHLVAAGGSTAFVTFDRDFARITDPPLPLELAT